MMKNLFCVVVGFMLLSDSSLAHAFSYAELMTEQSNEKTKHLSSILMDDTDKGLSLLHQIDYEILPDVRVFQEQAYSKLVCDVIRTIQNNGRVFFLGSGSSGRIALNLAAQWNELFKKENTFYQNRVIGIIAGGIRAFIRAKEGFEDSEQEGYKALLDHNLSSKDIVFLLSASGSAAFNHGAALAALARNSCCYHVINVPQTLPKAEELFTKGVVPVRIVTQPQAIKGSTRLQAATATHFCLGMTLIAAAHQLVHKSDNDQVIAEQMIIDFEKICQKIRSAIPKIKAIVEEIVQVLSSPKSNFRKIKDETDYGYVTYLGINFLREIITDSVELSPTFSINPTRALFEKGKREEFRAFMLGARNNADAWQQVCSRPLTNFEVEATADMILGGVDQEEKENLLSRPVGKGNLVLIIVNDFDNKDLVRQVLGELFKKEGKAFVIHVSAEEYPFLNNQGIETDLFLGGVTSTLMQGIALKLILNLISNATMIKMGKVCGNLMIDVSASNKKLLDRTVRIIREVYTLQAPERELPSYEIVNDIVNRVQNQKKLIELTESVYVPSTVKIASVMLLKNISFQEALERLIHYEENLDSILS